MDKDINPDKGPVSGQDAGQGSDQLLYCDRTAGDRVFAKGGGKETLFRVTIRGQISLIGIMDSKANLIISINTLIITGVLGFFTSSFFLRPGVRR